MVTTKVVEVVNQKLEDFKEEVIARLDRIETKLTYTNGKIAKAITDIEVMKKSEEDCPARNYHINITDKRDWSMFWAVLGSSIFSAVVITIILKVLHL